MQQPLILVQVIVKWPKNSYCEVEMECTRFTTLPFPVFLCTEPGSELSNAPMTLIKIFSVTSVIVMKTSDSQRDMQWRIMVTDDGCPTVTADGISMCVPATRNCYSCLFMGGEWLFTGGESLRTAKTWPVPHRAFLHPSPPSAIHHHITYWLLM